MSVASKKVVEAFVCSIFRAAPCAYTPITTDLKGPCRPLFLFAVQYL